MIEQGIYHISMKTKLDVLLTELQADAFVREYYETNKALLATQIDLTLNKLTLIDLDKLPNQPISFKELLLRWLIRVNRPRLEQNEKPILTIELIKMCPIWSVVKLSIKKVTADRGTLNKPSKLATTRDNARRQKGIK